MLLLRAINIFTALSMSNWYTDATLPDLQRILSGVMGVALVYAELRRVQK